MESLTEGFSRLQSSPYALPLFILVLVLGLVWWNRRRQCQLHQYAGGSEAAHPPALTEEHFAEEEEAKEPAEPEKTVVLFWADWCGHCKTVKPVWDQMMAKYQAHPTIALDEVNCAQNKEVAEQFQIEGFPTIIMFNKSGQPVKYQGDRSPEDLEKFVNSN